MGQSPGRQRPIDAQVIPFGRSYRRLQADPQHGRANTRAIRPIDVVVLLPLIIPSVTAILLGLLGWFVAWLAVVAALVVAIVFGDLARCLWRRNDRTLDRQPVG
jgi:hypothetical protein